MCVVAAASTIPAGNVATTIATASVAEANRTPRSGRKKEAAIFEIISYFAGRVVIAKSFGKAGTI
jgi:hypothetical protein